MYGKVKILMYVGRSAVKRIPVNSMINWELQVVLNTKARFLQISLCKKPRNIYFTNYLRDLDATGVVVVAVGATNDAAKSIKDFLFLRRPSSRSW